MSRIVMFNPSNNIKIVTTKEFENKWKNLGFIVLTNFIPLKKVG